MTTQQDRYEARMFGGLNLVEFQAVTGAGQVYPLGSHRTVGECREYAAEAGLTAETVTHSEGVATFTWTQPAVAEWTVERVRELMPQVRVYDWQTREEADATIRGRLRAFPLVERVDGKGGSYEFAWSQIAGALNAGRPLIV